MSEDEAKALDDLRDRVESQGLRVEWRPLFGVPFGAVCLVFTDGVQMLRPLTEPDTVRRMLRVS